MLVATEDRDRRECVRLAPAGSGQQWVSAL